MASIFNRANWSAHCVSLPLHGVQEQSHAWDLEVALLKSGFTFSRMAAALGSSLQLHMLPKSTITLEALVLQDDGGALPAAISCASVIRSPTRPSPASIASYGLVAACSCALLGDPDVALDANAHEQANALGSVTVACMPLVEHLTLLLHDGAVPSARVANSVQLALSGCSLLHEQMTKALVAKLEREQQHQEAVATAASETGASTGIAPE